MSKKVNASKTAIELAEHLEIDLADIPVEGKINKKHVEDFHAGKLKAEDETEEPESETDEVEDEDQDDSEDADEEEEQEPEVPEVKLKGKLVCVFNIKEDKRNYKAGEIYKGSNAKYLLKRKSIKKV